MDSNEELKHATLEEIESGSIPETYFELDESLRVDRETIEAGLDHVRAAPRDHGKLELIVCRPAEDERRVLETADINFDGPLPGLVGDNHAERRSEYPRGPAGYAQWANSNVGIVNRRYLDLIAGGKERWPLAGDQLYVDMDLSVENLPVGARIRIGSVVLEITDVEHSGCAKFSRRFGLDALRVINSREHKHLRLRGLYGSVVEEGRVSRGDVIYKV